MCEAANEKPAAEDTLHRLCSCNPLQPADPRVAGESQASESRLNPADGPAAAGSPAANRRIMIPA